MTRRSNTSKSLTFLISSAGAILAGWALNKYGKDKAKALYADASNSVKAAQTKWYLDGQKKATELEKIKQDVTSKL